MTRVAATKTVSLALQGGGAHGAFTWGVLDHILEDGRLRIEAFSAASAGAVNAVALMDGWMNGGAEGARAKLESFWHDISFDSKWNPSQRTAIATLMTGWPSLGNPVLGWWTAWLQTSTSPYDAVRMAPNTLLSVLDEQIDFERMRSNDAFKLSISATNVETGHIRIFERPEITARHVMASACLPTLFKAVTIDGVPYWDGGYLGNPALYPLFYGVETDDVLLVQVNPTRRKGVPKTAREIQTRLNEITFNATLLREFRAVEFVARLVGNGTLPASRYKQVRMHRIDSGTLFSRKGATGKLDSGWDNLRRLRDAGRKAAKSWLTENYDAIGRRATLDLRAELGME